MRGLTRACVIVAVAVALFVTVLRIPAWSPLTARAIDDVGQLLAAAVATWCGWRRSRRSTGPVRRSWQCLTAATACWAGGEAVWSYYELIGQRDAPFPSAADAGFLLFPLLAGIGMLSWPSAALRNGGRWRTLLDGTLVAGSLFLLSWATALGSTIRLGSTSLLAYLVSVAYPIADLVLLTMTVVVVARAGHAMRSGLTILAVGLASLCIADSGFAYLTALGSYHTGSLVDAGWFAGFLLLAAAASSTSSQVEEPAGRAVESTGTMLLPYLPAGVGLAAGLMAGLNGRGSTVTLVAAALVVAALLGRQLLAVLDNRQLVHEVLAAQDALHHQAFHDPLTGLANRALFTDRLRHGLELHRRDLRPLTLLYCDLDGFKNVNDTLGHDAGDSVLRATSERLQAVTRRGDTLARLGGDEFAILLEDGGDVTTITGRILGGFARPVVVDTHVLAVGVSIGIAVLEPGSAPVTPTELLRRADSAMYEAKRGGKGTASTWSEPVAPQAVGA